MSIPPSSTIWRIACVQLNSQNDLEANIVRACNFITQAHQQGANVVTLPENVAFMGKNKDELLAHSFRETQHPALAAFKTLAASLRVWILVGSLPIIIPNNPKRTNRSFLIAPDGKIHARYTKIHLYDVSVEGGESHQESLLFTPGKTASVISTPFGKLGMTICYDVRFPHLFRRLAQKGAQLITVPSAFTSYTGKAHWHVLLRARAIETASYIIAPAQVGTHPSGRSTYGHSLIIDPWGTVLADGGEREGVVLADIDLDYVTRIRQQLPSLHLQSSFSIAST